MPRATTMSFVSGIRKMSLASGIPATGLLMRGDPNWTQRAPNFTIRKLSDMDMKQAQTQTVFQTVLRAGQSTQIHYKDPVEALLITSGSGSLELVSDGRGEGEGFAQFRLEPGTFYGLGGQDNHYLKADPDTDMVVSCAFTPSTNGIEDHHKEYTAMDAIFAQGSLPGISPLPCSLNLSSKNAVGKTHSNYSVRVCEPGDGKNMWSICNEVGMDENSPYLYNLFSTMHSQTCVIATDEESGNPVGYILGFIPPERPDTYFVWQIGAVSSTRGTGLAHHMLDRIVKHSGSTHVEASVTPDNIASNKFFQKFAKQRDAAYTLDEQWMPAEHFPSTSQDHEREALYRIGPIQ